jgi:hypothetical protein
MYKAVKKVSEPKLVVRTISVRIGRGRRGVAPTVRYHYPAIRYYDEVTDCWRAVSLRRVLYGDSQDWRETLISRL